MYTNKFAIRVDASESIGLGHLMRCLEIAKELKFRGLDIYFITYLNSQTKILMEHNYNIINLNEYIFENELDIVIDILRQNKIEQILIDKYNIEFCYFHELKKYSKKVIYMDDLNEYSYPVDIIINGNITSLYLDYKKYSKNTNFLLGPKYYIIRDEFIKEKEKKVLLKKCDRKSILITTGGSDYKQFSLKILSKIIKMGLIESYIINLVVGPGYCKEVRNQLMKISKEYKNIKLLIEPKNMAREINCNDIIITAGGGTLYEALFLNKKIIAFIYAKNQEKIVKILEREKIIHNMGWFDDIRGNLNDIMIDLNNIKLKSIIETQFEIHPNGAKNIVDKILN